MSKVRFTKSVRRGLLLAKDLAEKTLDGTSYTKKEAADLRDAIVWMDQKANQPAQKSKAVPAASGEATVSADLGAKVNQ